MHLYEYTEQYKQALTTLNDSDLPIEAIQDTLEGMKGEIKLKGKDVGAFIKTLEADATAIKEAEKKMMARRKAIEAKTEWLRNYLVTNMVETGIKSISCPYFEIKTRKNPASLIIGDESLIPDEYKTTKTVTVIQNAAIKQDLKDGKEVAGAYLHNKTSLVIK